MSKLTINGYYPLCASGTDDPTTASGTDSSYTWVSTPTVGTNYGARWWYKDFHIGDETYRYLSVEISIGGNTTYTFSWSDTIGFAYTVEPRFYHACLHTSQNSDECVLVRTLNTTDVILYQSNSSYNGVHFECFGQIS